VYITKIVLQPLPFHFTAMTTSKFAQDNKIKYLTLPSALATALSFSLSFLASLVSGRYLSSSLKSWVAKINKTIQTHETKLSFRVFSPLSQRKKNSHRAPKKPNTGLYRNRVCHFSGYRPDLQCYRYGFGILAARLNMKLDLSFFGLLCTAVPIRRDPPPHLGS
jgi:hypothetical protein